MVSKVKNSDLYEGLPNSLLPVIATDCLSGPSEILLNGDLVKVEQLSKSIIKNLTDREYAKAKQKIAYKHLYRFSYDEVKKDIFFSDGGVERTNLAKELFS